MTIARILRRTAIAAAALGAALAGSAHAATCGIISSGTTSATVNYDPFNPTGLGATPITLQLQRVNGNGGEKTDIVNFYLRAHDSNADGTVVVANSVLVEGNFAGTGLDVFYDSTEQAPIVAPTSVDPSAGAKFLKIEFTGNNAASDNATVNFTVQLPPNLDLTNSPSLSFDAIFACSTTGGGPQSEQTGQINNAITFPIKVLNALQASYVGSDLSFGEIGNIANPLVVTPPTTSAVNNYVRVRSSGAYEVKLTSENAYRLTYPGGNLTDANQRVNYQLEFLGTSRTESNPALISKTCTRAGVPAGEEDRLYIRATLREGGQGKLVAPDYKDTLTVTISPLAAPVAPVPCSGLLGP